MASGSARLSSKTSNRCRRRRTRHAPATTRTSAASHSPRHELPDGRESLSLPPLPQVPVRAGSPCFDNACSACCHDIEMLLTDADLARIQAHLAATGRDGLDFWFRADDGYLQLRTRDGPAARGGAGRPCVFLDPSGACSIHEARPEGCRLYPAVWDEGLREAELDDAYCPHTDGFLLPRATSDAVGRLAARLQAERKARVAGSSP
ncbi:MAG: YkgJ family cysteine cluster protein [Thermoplasmatota archaeon]